MSNTAIELHPASQDQDILTLDAAMHLPRGQGGVLILGGAHGSVAVARSLGRKGIPVWFIGNDHPITRYSRYTRRHFTWEGPAAPGAVDMLCALAVRENIQDWVLFPAGDAELQFISQNHTRLTEHFRVFTMPWEALEPLNDKSQLYRLAKTIGVDCPMVYDETGAEPPPVVFPVIIKPSSTERPNALTRAKAWRIDDADQFRQKFAEATDLMGKGGFVVQEMVPGDGMHQYSYAAIWDRGKEVVSMTARRARQFPVDFGLTSTFVETVDEPRVAEAARRLLTATSFHGLVEAEFKHDARVDKFKLLDVNTRAWAWIGLGLAAGIDFPFLTWLLATGQALPDVASLVGVSWVHPARNFLSVLQDITRGRLRSSAWRSMFKRSTLATFAPDDLKPGFAEFPVQVTRLLRRFRTAAPPPVEPAVRATARE